MKNANQNALYFCSRCSAVGFYRMATGEEKIVVEKFGRFVKKG